MFNHLFDNIHGEKEEFPKAANYSKKCKEKCNW